MARTELKERGSNVKKMTDRERAFCAEYPKDHNATQAAIRAGYSRNTAQVTGSKLLAKVHIQNQIGKVERLHIENVGMKVEEVLEQIHSALTRQGSDFIDPATGELIPIHNLPKRANQAIDGIEQKVTIIERENMPPLKVIETKLKLVPKASAMDMAMKHFGAYAAEKTETTTRVSFEFDSLTQNPRPDLVEEEIAKARIVDGTVTKKGKP